ncbi:MAG: hypothetical protein HYY26_00580 [Acidobacteria bacterium]|nr:hypothetical protein [Acidobacteriota bacterium]
MLVVPPQVLRWKLKVAWSESTSDCREMQWLLVIRVFGFEPSTSQPVHA